MKVVLVILEPGKMTTSSSFNGFPGIFRFDVPEGTQNFIISSSMSSGDIKFDQLIDLGYIPSPTVNIQYVPGDRGYGCLKVKTPQAGTYFFVANAKTEAIFNNLNVRVDFNSGVCILLERPAAIVLN
jgi:hypothetical protein